MRLLLDMNLPRSLTEWLRSAGHDAVHVGEIGLQAVPDEVVFAWAVQEARAVVTLDLDFGSVARFAAGARNGVVLLRLRTVGMQHLRQRLRFALSEAEEPKTDQRSMFSRLLQSPLSA